MSSTRQHVVIVGASAAGVSAAFALRQTDFDGLITLVDRDGREPYERPPLSKTLLSAGTELVRPIAPREKYAERGIHLALGRTVTALRPATQQVVLDDGCAVDASQVLLATGVEARRLPPGVVVGSASRHVFYLRDAADAEVLRQRLSEGGPLVIVGGGYVGLELAAEAAGIGIETTVVEAAPVPLARTAGNEIGSLVQELHESHGVRFCLNAMVSEITDEAGYATVSCDNGARLRASTVVIGIGVAVTPHLAADVGVKCSDGIVVNEFGQTDNPWVWATGDIAVQPHPSLERPGRIEHWDSAVRHGQAVGRSMAGVPTRFESAPYAWSDQYGLTIQSFGRMWPRDEFVLRADARSDRFIGYSLRDGRVIGVTGLDMGRDVAAARQLIERRVTVTATDLASPDLDVRGLVRRVAAR
ncbi:NAD(P)/FAD-dependent oxidoreductase [Streptomyces umbrinus]|uniref:NAD(P)/FAD-dependent oxidoreductase n=1 Tax=Streptomyces umbrinus TaxID=67370 RepID=UPI0033F80052